ncbi:hypothetical protein K8R61_02515 [bacterium]|nr:hypothetical protein [bacterium]
MAKKFENILAQNEDEKITEQELDELATKLSKEIETEIDCARTKDKKSFGYNCVKVFNKNDIQLASRPRLFEKIEDIIKNKSNIEYPDWRIASSKKDQLREERRAGQPYTDTDL